MKKILSISVSLIYLVLTMGLVIHVHYCQDKVHSFAVYTDAESCCGESCEMAGNCCHDKQFVVQLEPMDNIIPAAPDLAPVFSILSSVFYVVEESVLSITSIPNISYDLPPPKTPIWKVNCSFIFYG